jgi:hypothetical protein
MTNAPAAEIRRLGGDGRGPQPPGVISSCTCGGYAALLGGGPPPWCVNASRREGAPGGGIGRQMVSAEAFAAVPPPA